MPSNDLGYFSHFPVLAAALAKTEGPVLELGMGWGSTPLLHAVCHTQKRPLVSYESDGEWYRLMSGLFAKPGHAVVPILGDDDWVGGPKFFDGDRWGVVFIDFAPGELRKDVALALKDSADFIVLHDALQDPPHAGGNYRYEEIIPKFKHHEYYGVLRPPSLILSNREPFGLGWQQKVQVVL